MKAPTIFTPEDLEQMNLDVWVSQKTPYGLRWVHPRRNPETGLCLFQRIHAAWLVFFGRADVVRWQA